MSDPARFLTALAQALAKMSLYSEGHPARGRAADVSFEQLRELQATDPHPSFSFLGSEVVYNDHALRELRDWDWANKLASVGVQRLEFEGIVEPSEYRAFLDSVLTRISTVAAAASEAQEAQEAHAMRPTPIRFGAIGVRGSAAEGEVPDESQGSEGAEIDAAFAHFDLSDEADAVMWMHQEVGASHTLPLIEAEAVISSLALAMHGDRRVMLPLLSLKEFDQYTTTHALNVSVLAMGLAEYMGLSPREIRAYGVAGLLHDLGKVKIPHEILCKPGQLTPEEFAIVRAHPVEGAKLIIESDRHLDLCAVVAFEHHIMIDGGGYPARHTRRDCHAASMLVHICDVFDALRTHRPYRVAWETAQILSYIERRLGTEFNAEAGQAFLLMMTEWESRLAVAKALEQEQDFALVSGRG